MARANSMLLIFTRTTEPTHNQRNLFRSLPLAEKGWDEGGNNMPHHVGSISAA